MFQECHRLLAGVSKDFVLHGLARPGMSDLIERIINEEGRQNKRVCPLRPRLVLWLVIAMSLYRDCSIINVFERLVSIVKEREPRLYRGTVTQEAICKARARLGFLPLMRLHEELVRNWKSAKERFHGLRVVGIDGSEFTIPDTEENEEIYGRHRNHRGPAAYPSLRGLFKVDVASHRICKCFFFPRVLHESTPLRPLLKTLVPGDLLLMDRGLTSFLAIHTCINQGANFLLRVSGSWKPKFLRKLGNGDTLMRFKACKVARQSLPAADKDITYDLRVIEFTVGKGKLVRLVTDLMDPDKYPAIELAELYHQRWECEIAYKQLKSQLVAVTASKQQTHFRSKTPVGVMQEAWGMVLAHTLIRELMMDGAELAGISPTVLSLTDSLEVIKLSLRNFHAGGRRHRAALRRKLIQQISECRIDRPRRNRQCPRVVKRKMSNFRLKRPGDRAGPLDKEIRFKL